MSTHRPQGHQAPGSTRSISSTRRRALREFLRQRDGDDCWVCGLPLDWEGDRLGPLAGTLDHIHPVRDGGTCTRTNLRLAHRVCNQGRERRK